ESICYTELAYERINKKLNVKLSKKQIENYILDILNGTDISFFARVGKNYYIVNAENNIRITINSNTFRIITVDRVK
ncbi:MAG: DUF3781 domain-containing protein, partial [Bacteroidales bacterium]